MARREYSRAALRQQLLAREHPAEEVDAALDRLAEAGLQSDARWAESLARRRRAQGYGPLRISAEIRAKGGEADPGLTEAGAGQPAALPAGDEVDDLARALALLDRRFPAAGMGEPRLRARALRLLTSRGYPVGLAVRAVSMRSHCRSPERRGDGPEGPVGGSE